MALSCPLCTLNRLLFQSLIHCGSSVLKALPTCLYVGTVETTRLSIVVPPSGAVDTLPVWGSTVSPYRSGEPRTQGADPSLEKTNKKKQTSHGTSVSKSPATDKFSFIQEVWSNVCRFQKPVFGFRRLFCWTTCAFFSQRSVLAVFFGCSSSGALVLLQVFYNAKMLAFWMGLPDFFLHGSFFVWRIKKKDEKLVLYTDLM